LKRSLLSLAAALAAVLATGTVTGAGPASAAPSYTHLNPGGAAEYQEKVPVNVVFVGYDRDAVSPYGFSGGLPSRYEPVVRSRLNYGITEKLGIRYGYDYNLSYTDAAYENKFFSRLAALARPAPLTAEQTLYNKQKGNVLTVTKNHHIDAPSVERYLALNPPSGVDTRRNTIFFINWFGRSDFKFHVYTKTDEPDPDTGYNFGRERSSRKIIAWGGTTADDEETGLGSQRRVWFHDLSAGPESWTSNWNVDNPDLDGNGAVDYRMPPIWEYRYNGFRAPRALAGDLGKITRYVAINLLFTSSPLYPADINAPDLPKSINLDSNTYEGWTGVNASERYLRPQYATNEIREVRPDNVFSYDNQDLAFNSEARRCYVGQLSGESCYPILGYPSFANLFLYNAFNLRRTQDDRGRVDYELPIFNYAVNAGVGAPALGFADDNYRDGTQSFVFNFVSPEIVAAGYGLTTTFIHEVGHHIALSHPHDGYDSQRGINYGPGDEFFFAWAGDETNSMMSYIDLNWDFSQFDRDNMFRFLAAGYTEGANTIAAQVLADDNPRAGYDELRAADGLIGRSKAAFASHDYLGASRLAQAAHAQARRAAAAVGQKVASQAEPADVSAARTPSGRAAARQETGFLDTLGPHTPRNRP